MVAPPVDANKSESSIGRQADYLRAKFEKLISIAVTGDLMDEPNSKIALALQDFEQSLKQWIANPPSRLLMRRQSPGLLNLHIKPNPKSMSRMSKFARNFSFSGAAASLS